MKITIETIAAVIAEHEHAIDASLSHNGRPIGAARLSRGSDAARRPRIETPHELRSWADDRLIAWFNTIPVERWTEAAGVVETAIVRAFDRGAS